MDFIGVVEQKLFSIYTWYISELLHQ